MARKGSRACRFGRVASGPRKGRCRKVGRCKAYAPYLIGGKTQYRCASRAGAKHPKKSFAESRVSGPVVPARVYNAMKRGVAAAKKAARRKSRGVHPDVAAAYQKSMSFRFGN